MIRITSGKNRSTRSGGFTLIELVVVIAIIGLLIAILIPGLQLANEAANQLICQTHLNPLFKGSMMFTEDHPESRLPYFRWIGTRPQGTEWWVTEAAQGMEVLEPEVYRCPSHAKPPGLPFWRVGGNWHMPGAPTDRG